MKTPSFIREGTVLYLGVILNPTGNHLGSQLIFNVALKRRRRRCLFVSLAVKLCGHKRTTTLSLT